MCARIELYIYWEYICGLYLFQLIDYDADGVAIVTGWLGAEQVTTTDNNTKHIQYSGSNNNCKWFNRNHC